MAQPTAPRPILVPIGPHLVPITSAPAPAPQPVLIRLPTAPVPTALAPTAHAELQSLVSDQPSWAQVAGWSFLALTVAGALAYIVSAFVLPLVFPGGPSGSSGGSGGGTASQNQDCLYGEWGPWLGCDAGTPSECGFGVAVAFRTIVQEEMGTGTQCDESEMVREVPCSVLNAEACAQLDCAYTDWTDWSTCPDAPACAPDNGSCAPQAIQYRTRAIAHEAQPGGEGCTFDQLYQQRACPPPSATCGPPIDCVPEPWSDSMWEGCPDICVPADYTGPSVTELARRGVQTFASGGGQDCDPNDFVRTRPCVLPTCSECSVTQWGAWSQCDTPCGAGVSFRVGDLPPGSGGPFQTCQTTQVQDCPVGDGSGGSNAGACPVGGFNLGSGGPVAQTLFPHVLDNVPPGLTLGEALEACVRNPECAGVNWDGTGGTWLTDMEGGTSNSAWTGYEFDPTYDGCVPPTWPMLDAACLNLCSTPGQGAPRGIAFAFGPPAAPTAVSCPVTLPLLAAVSGCSVSAQSGTFSDASCPASTDCVYQDWADAPVWGQCDTPCAGGNGGSRIRTRDIVAPPSFMGAPCDPNQLIMTAACNSPTASTDAPGMVCLPTSGLVAADAFAVTSAAACGVAQHNAAGTFGYSYVDGAALGGMGGPSSVQVFYADLGHYDTRANVDAQLFAHAAAGGFSDWRYSTAEEIAAAYAAGAQWCATGFFDESDNIGMYPMQESGVPGCGGAGIVQFSVDGAGAWVTGTKPTAAQATALEAATSVSVQAWYTSYTTGSNTPVNTTWDMPVQSAAWGGACLLHALSVDSFLANSECYAASAPASAAVDVSCGLPVPCSLTAWTDETQCPACGPPFIKWQTRDVYHQAYNGGTPCSDFLQVQSVSCDPAPPSCTTLESPTVYGEWPTVQPAGTAPCLALSGTVYPNAWSVPVQATHIIAGTFDAVTSCSSGAMPQALADAVNAACLNGDGSAPTCIAAGGTTYELQTQSVTGGFVYTAWAPSTSCTPDPQLMSCVGQRATAACSHLAWDASLSACACPSTCLPSSAQGSGGGQVAACAWSACSADCKGYPGTQLLERQALQVGPAGSPWPFSPAEVLWSAPCTGGPSLPACPIACPIAPDGSPCGSLSGHGVCDTTTGACQCTSGAFSQPACWFGCPVDGAGTTCSGHGTCDDLGECTCAAGWAGFDCSARTVPVLWNFDEAFGYVDWGCATNWKQCNVCADTADVPSTFLLFSNILGGKPTQTGDASYITSSDVTCADLGFTTPETYTFTAQPSGSGFSQALTVAPVETSAPTSSTAPVLNLAINNNNWASTTALTRLEFARISALSYIMTLVNTKTGAAEGTYFLLLSPTLDASGNIQGAYTGTDGNGNHASGAFSQAIVSSECTTIATLGDTFQDQGFTGASCNVAVPGYWPGST